MVYRILAVVLFQALFGSIDSKSQTNIYQFHSLLMDDFVKEIHWSGQSDRFTVGVYGSRNALKVVKAYFEGKKIEGKEIRVIEIVGIGDANASQLVYMPKSNKGQILNLYEQAEKENTLFVSEDDLIEAGLQICFFMDGPEMRFRLSKKNMASSGLEVSPVLLSQAALVD